VQRTKTYGFVPFSPHMSPKTDWKLKQFKLLLMQKATFEKRSLFCLRRLRTFFEKKVLRTPKNFGGWLEDTYLRTPLKKAFRENGKSEF